MSTMFMVSQVDHTYAAACMPRDWSHQGKVPATPTGMGGLSKALPIRNPKTGEVIAGAPMLAEELNKKLQTARTRQVLLGRAGIPPAIRLSAVAAAKGGLAATVLAKRGGARWCADRSTFSALNIESSHRHPCATHMSDSMDLLHSAQVRNKRRQSLLGGNDVLMLPTTETLEASTEAQPGESQARAEGAATIALSSCEPSVCDSTSSMPQGAPLTAVVEEPAGGDEVADIEAVQAGSASMEQSPMEARAQLLAFRHVEFDAQAPGELATMCAHEFSQQELQALISSSPPSRLRPTGLSPKSPHADETSDRFLLGSARRDRAGSDRNIRNTPKAKSSESLGSLTPSENAYRVQRSERSRNEDMLRSVQSHLNKICPENVATIAEKLAEIKVQDLGELKQMISLIFKKALAEPHYCETYADLVFSLKSVFPEFPGEEGRKPVTFKSTLLNICQDEFEALPTSLEPTDAERETCDAEEIEYQRKKKKDRLLANMKFIGHLFLRQLLSAKVIGSVLMELVLCGNETEVPQEHVIECACELLLSIGCTLEAMPAGAPALKGVCGRLKDLKNWKGKDGRGVYSKRIQFAIQDLLETRSAGWTKKTFKTTAKTKEEIRLEQQRELVAQSKGKDVGGSEHVVAGQRPVYIATITKKEK
mmetsp:Transcript_18639/g.51100  ORF Transcript_18639/g.51100 Transcript_18639/m.51100 type:complete len:651 (-) Transcript_18639:292-2244(-)